MSGILCEVSRYGIRFAEVHESAAVTTAELIKICGEHWSVFPFQGSPSWVFKLRAF